MSLPHTAAESFHRGMRWQAQGVPHLAAGWYRRALRLNPLYTPARINLGAALEALGDELGAIVEARRAQEQRPNDPLVHYNVGVLLQRPQREPMWSDAAEAYKHALACDATFLPAYTNAAQVALGQGRLADAEALDAQGLAVAPGDQGLRTMQAVLRWYRGEIDEAIQALTQLVEESPYHQETLLSLAKMLRFSGRTDEARLFLQLLHHVSPGWAPVYHELGSLCLQAGDWSQGWQIFQREWTVRGQIGHPYACPTWAGDALQGRRLLIRCDFGAGDVLQFLRLVPWLPRDGAILIEAHARHLPLLHQYRGLERVARMGHFGTIPTDAYDCAVSLWQVPWLLALRPQDLSATTLPAIVPDPARVARWRRRLDATARLRIGLCWEVSRMLPFDAYRTIPLTALAPLMAVPDIAWYQLQAKADADTRPAWAVAIRNWTGEMDGEGAFLDTAALMTSLDLVITVDTSIAHLAGLLGLPTWLLLSYAPEWRWPIDQAQTPWYPTMRLFRQPRPGAWAPLIAQLTDLLYAEAA